MNTNPNLTLNNGVEMPALGFGVYQSSPQDTITSVQTALETGYRLIDTAAAYGNEREVGEGMRRSGVERKDTFLTTKLWISDYGYDETMVGFDASLRRLGTDYVDLYLMHWPMPKDFEKTVGSWKAVEQILKDGRARAIGMCNSSPQDLDALAARTDIVPAVNQVELHPYFTQKQLEAYDKEHGIVTQAWSPIGGVNVYSSDDPAEQKNVLLDTVVTEIAEKYGKTAAQVVLRWHLQQGRSAIPKSVRPERIKENFDVFDFELTDQDLAAIDALDTGLRGGPDPALVDTEMFPAVIDNS
ncbi:aldo/keto reductase [Corynebacterium lubricantis]|uniref:aldo/keto reductase n=1 Tax=Corynebacterium lubricantis TaxID=541095 RepID=UPI000373A1FD|nr:aldo/keto reductase [Corynebacterium lubricantis]